MGKEYTRLVESAGWITATTPLRDIILKVLDTDAPMSPTTVTAMIYRLAGEMPGVIDPLPTIVSVRNELERMRAAQLVAGHDTLNKVVVTINNERMEYALIEAPGDVTLIEVTEAVREAISKVLERRRDNA